jgi:hypothetical protein
MENLGRTDPTELPDRYVLFEIVWRDGDDPHSLVELLCEIRNGYEHGHWTGSAVAYLEPNDLSKLGQQLQKWNTRRVSEHVLDFDNITVRFVPPDGKWPVEAIASLKRNDDTNDHDPPWDMNCTFRCDPMWIDRLGKALRQFASNLEGSFVLELP